MTLFPYDDGNPCTWEGVIYERDPDGHQEQQLSKINSMLAASSGRWGSTNHRNRQDHCSKRADFHPKGNRSPLFDPKFLERPS